MSKYKKSLEECKCPMCKTELISSSSGTRAVGCEDDDCGFWITREQLIDTIGYSPFDVEIKRPKK